MAANEIELLRAELLKARATAEQAEARAARLQAVAAALSDATTLRDAAQVAVEQVTTALDASGGALTLVRGDELEIVAGCGVQAERWDQFRRLPISAPLPACDCLRAKRPVLICSPAEMRDGYPHLLSTLNPKYQAWASVPLLIDERAIGVAWFLFEEPRAFTGADDALMMAIGRQAAQAIVRAQLFEAERQARARAERVLALTAQLEEVTRQISRAMTADEMAAVAIRGIETALAAHATSIYLLNESGDALELFQSTGLRTEAIKRYSRVPMDLNAPLTEAVRRRTPLWIESLAQFAHDHPESHARLSRVVQEPALAMACLPLSADDRVFGALSVTFYADRPFDEDERRFLTLMADHCALALDRARVFGELRATALRAQAAERRKDEFLAMLGHELRNPLAPITTALQLMRLRGDSTTAREREVIERQVHHLERLVDDLLDVSRITRGKVELKRGPIDLAAVVAKALEMTGPLFEQKQHRLHVQAPEGSLLLDGDEDRLAQAVANLLTNAAKYSERGGEISVVGQRQGDEVTLLVRDQGIGIAPELLPHVFDLFIQAPQNLARSQGGLGLGLPIVKSLVELHGGTVRGHSDGPGRGSEFVITLPSQRHAELRVATAASVQVSPAHVRKVGRRVLVVDDNRDAAELLADALTDEGHRVDVAFDGPTALTLASEKRPEVILLDIGLPVMDGYEVAARLRRTFSSADLRLIALTGYGQESDRQRALAAGFDSHLVKPVDLTQVFAALDVTALKRG